MQLVILAAGHGRRFGGLKQLASVGPNGEAIMDYTALTAERNRFAGIVLVVREEIREEIQAHVAKQWPADIAVEFVCQLPRPGTAQAVCSAASAIDGPFAVANADDLYGETAFAALHRHFERSDASVLSEDHDSASVPSRHLLVAYQLDHTVVSSATVKRGLCAVSDDGRLESIVEHVIDRTESGGFVGTPLGSETSSTTGTGAVPLGLSGNEPVSMNLWGFHRRMLGHLQDALDAQADSQEVDLDHELLLPEVIGELVTDNKDVFHVVGTDAQCLGITHLEDVAIVRAALAADEPNGTGLRATRDQ